MSAGTETAIPVETRNPRALRREEVTLAQPFIGRVPWEMVIWGLGNFCVWVALFPLTLGGVIPLWAGFLFSTLCVSICYLPSHEAQHSIIAPKGSKLRWLNELVGHISTIPMVLPYRIAWITHRQHHAYANDPELDPDHDNKADTWWQSVWNGIKSRQPGADNAYRRFIETSDDPKLQRAMIESVILNSTFYAVLTGLAWSGYAIEAALLWWLPRHIGTSYIQLFLSWAPHCCVLEHSGVQALQLQRPRIALPSNSATSSRSIQLYSLQTGSCGYIYVRTIWMRVRPYTLSW